MANEVAGSITFKTAMDTVGITQGISNIKKAIAGMYGALAKSSGVASGSIDKITRTIERAKIKISEADKMLAEMYAKRDMMAESAINAAAPTPKARAKLSDEDVDKILKSNKAIQELDRQISSLDRKLTGYKLKLNEATAENSKFGNTLNAARENLKQMAQNLRGAGKNGDRAAKSIGRIREASGKAAKSIFNLGNMLKLMAVRMAMRAMLNAIGAGFKDLAVSNGKFNKTMSDLSTSMLTARNAIATAFAPAMQALTPLITNMIQSFVNAMNVIGAFSAAMFGNARSFVKAKQAQVDYAKSVNSAAKAQKGQALAIDELNSIADESAGAGGMPDPQEMFEEVEIPKETLSLAERIKALFQDMWLPLTAINFDPLIGALQRLFAVAAPLGKTLFEGLQWAYYNVFVPLAGWVIQDALPVFLDLLSAGLGVLNSVLEALKPLGMWLWEKFLKPLASWTGGLFISAMQVIIDILNGLANWIDLFAEKSTWYWVLLGGILESIVAGVVAMANDVISWVLRIYDEGIIPMVDMVIKAFRYLYDNGLQYFVKQVLAFVSAVIDLFMLIWDLAINPVLNFFLSEFIPKFLFGFENLIETIKPILSVLFNMFGSIIEVLNGVIKFVVGVFTGNWKKAWEGISDIFKGIYNGMITMIEGFVNGAISGINSIIRALNSIKFSIPDWIPIIGGKSWSANISTMDNVKIPRLATGAVIPPNNPFLAMLGDQKRGTNIEAPLDTIVQAVKQALAEDGGGSEKEIIIENVTVLDGEVIYKNQKKVKASSGYDLGFTG